jgi:hypothetical protein
MPSFSARAGGLTRVRLVFGEHWAEITETHEGMPGCPHRSRHVLGSALGGSFATISNVRCTKVSSVAKLGFAPDK